MRGALSEFGARAREDDAALVAIRRIAPDARCAAEAGAGASRAAASALMEFAGRPTEEPPAASSSCVAGAATARGLDRRSPRSGGPPYLALASLSPWIVTFAIGLFCALFATPFVIYARLGGELESDARWERAVLWWGAVPIGVLAAVGALRACRAGSTPTRWAARSASSRIAEAVLVLATLVILAAQRLRAAV